MYRNVPTFCDIVNIVLIFTVDSVAPASSGSSVVITVVHVERKNFRVDIGCVLRKANRIRSKVEKLKSHQNKIM